MLYKAAKSARPDAAAGRDGWRPAELALLPESAWEHRRRLLDKIIEVGRWLARALPCLRKADRLDPESHRNVPTVLDHRLLSVYTQLYRIEMSAWMRNHRSWLEKLIHPRSFGAMRGRECGEASWDTQSAIESAINGSEELVVALLDYYKFFDSFDPRFYAAFIVDAGIDWRLGQLFLHLNCNVRRRIKIGTTYGPEFTP